MIGLNVPIAEKHAIQKLDLDNALASVDVGKANVMSMEARVESAQIELGYCDIRAPVNGPEGFVARAQLTFLFPK